MTLGPTSPSTPAPASISFGGTVDGARALTVNGTGATTFAGAVGATTALSSLTSNTGGTAQPEVGDDIGRRSPTAKPRRWTAPTRPATPPSASPGPVTLAGATTVSTGTGSISFGGTVDGARALTVNGTGATTFSGAVGGTTALSSLTSDAGGTLSLKSVTTSGAQSYGEALTLNGTYIAGSGTFTASGNTTLDGAVTITAAGISFAGTVNGTQALSLSSGAGTIDLAGAVGDTTRLGALALSGSGMTTIAGAVRAASVTTDTSGGTVLRGGSVDTTGAQVYAEAVSLGADTTLSGTTVTLSAGADAATAGMQGLTIAGNAALTGSFAAMAALKSLAISGAATLGGGAIVTTESQGYGGAVTLRTAAQTLTSGPSHATTFSGTLAARRR